MENDQMRVVAFWILMGFVQWGGVCSAAEITTNTFLSKHYLVCRVELPRDRVRLFLKDDQGVYFRRPERVASWLSVRGERLVFAMNAGMYHQDATPVGLYISSGKMLTPLNTSTGYGNFFLKPNGVFAVTEAGARILETSEYARFQEKPLLATQSGPLLVQRGRIHPAFKADSSSRLIRNGVGLQSPAQLFWVITEEPVNFHEFATFFRDGLHCADALYLDGVISSVYAPSLSRIQTRHDLGPILGITE